MKYHHVKRAVFRLRPNRFIAECALDGESVTAHVPNTGRCRELLLPGATVYLEENANPGRKTRYTLVSVQKGERLVNIDSLAPNRAFGEAAAAGLLRLPGFDIPLARLAPERTFGASRFDFYLESGRRKGYAEVKGVTLEENGVALFPDAPTARGLKHVRALAEAVRAGYSGFVIFVIQMADVRYFAPNRQMHPAFADALLEAQAAGVDIRAYDCDVAPDEMRMRGPVPVHLNHERS